MPGGGKRGKKRGAPASKSDGSGGRKSGGDDSGDRKRGGYGSSGGLVRREGGSEEWKEAAALKEAGKLSQARPQSSLLDVKIVRWALKIDSHGIVRMCFQDFKAVLRRRRRLFKRVMSLNVNGTPVTQSSFVKESYHIVEITVNGKAVLQFLFRESDGYLIAFRLVKNSENLLAWEGWFHFKDNDKDIIFPDFFGERKSVGWDAGYHCVAHVSICKHTMPDLVTCLLDFKQDNCTKRHYGNYDRVLVLETWMVLLGECQRSGLFLDFVERHHNSEEPSPVGEERKDHLHSWSNMSTLVLHVYLAILMKKYGDRGWEDELRRAELGLSQGVQALSNFGYTLIKSYIIFRPLSDGTFSDIPNGELSMPLLLGTDVGHLLHLVKCDDDHVLKIHKLMRKYRDEWTDAGTESDSESEIDTKDRLLKPAVQKRKDRHGDGHEQTEELKN